MQMIFQVVPILILVYDVINYANSKHARVKLIGGRTIRQIPISSRSLTLSGGKKKKTQRYRGKLRPPQPLQTAPLIPPSHQVNNEIKIVQNVYTI